MSQVCKITEPLCNITLQQEKNWAPEEVQGDYDYFMAQKAAELLLENKLIVVGIRQIDRTEPQDILPVSVRTDAENRLIISRIDGSIQHGGGDGMP